MSKINTIAIVFVFMTMVSGAVNAQTTRGPVVDDYWAGQVGQCVDQINMNCGDCAGKGGFSHCNESCMNVVNVNCGGTVKAADRSRASGVTKAWVRAQIKKAVAGLVTREEFDRAIGEIRAEIAGIKDDLKRNWDDHEKIRDEIQERADAQKETDRIQDNRLTDLERRADENDRRDDEQDAEIATLQDEVRFEIGAQFFGAPHLLSIGAAAGVQLRIADYTSVFGDLGIGYAFDKDIAVLAKGGVMFYLGKTKSFGLGPVALFAHEGFDDDGDVEVGGGVEIRYQHSNGFFIAGDIGLGGEGVLQVVGSRPDGEDLTDREWGLAVMGGLMIGGSF